VPLAEVESPTAASPPYSRRRWIEPCRSRSWLRHSAGDGEDVVTQDLGQQMGSGPRRAFQVHSGEVATLVRAQLGAAAIRVIGLHPTRRSPSSQALLENQLAKRYPHCRTASFAHPETDGRLACNDMRTRRAPASRRSRFRRHRPDLSRRFAHVVASGDDVFTILIQIAKAAEAVQLFVTPRCWNLL